MSKDSTWLDFFSPSLSPQHLNSPHIRKKLFSHRHNQQQQQQQQQQGEGEISSHLCCRERHEKNQL